MQQDYPNTTPSHTNLLNQSLTDPQLKKTKSKKTNSETTHTTKSIFAPLIQRKKALYDTIKKLHLKQIAENIDQGKNTNLSFDRFVYMLIEEGAEQKKKQN